ALRIGADDLGVELALVEERDLDFLGVGNDVVVREDVAVARDDDARAHALLAPLPRVGTHPGPEEYRKRHLPLNLRELGERNVDDRGRRFLGNVGDVRRRSAGLRERGVREHRDGRGLRLGRHVGARRARARRASASEGQGERESVKVRATTLEKAHREKLRSLVRRPPSTRASPLGGAGFQPKNTEGSRAIPAPYRPRRDSSLAGEPFAALWRGSQLRDAGSSAWGP